MTAVVWSFWTIWAASAEVWAAALTLPLTRSRPGRSARTCWAWACRGARSPLGAEPFGARRAGTEGRPWLIGWLQVCTGVL